MKKLLKKIFILSLIVIFIIAFSSSYSSLSIDNLAYVLAIAIDTSTDNKLEVSFQFSNSLSPNLDLIISLPLLLIQLPLLL